MYTENVKRETAIKILLPGLLFCFVLAFQSCSSGNWSVPSAASNLSPAVVITSPFAGNISDEGTNVTFTGSANDPEDGALSGASLVWTSDRDGQIGTGLTFGITTLSRGVHVITLTATDGSGDQGTATMTITVRTPWFGAQWGFRQRITISASMAPSDQTDFPALVKITDQLNPLFDNAQPDGDDILFTDLDGVNQLDHEIELYRNTGTAELDAWVRIPNLSSTSDTILYMYYSSSGALNQENVNGVWDSNFTLVQHLQETSGTHLDSTSNNNDSTSVNVTVQGTATGQINGADEFVGASQNDITLPLLRNLIDNFKTDNDATDDHGTIEIWMYPTGPPESNDNVYALPPVWADNWQVGGVFRGEYPSGSGNDKIWVVSSLGTPAAILSTDYTVDQWVHIAWVYTTDGVLHGYKNGSEFDSAAASGATAGYLYIGSSGSPTRGFFTGNIDEMRISSIARSAEWIEATYNNQDNPAGFLTFNPEELF